MVWLWTSHPFPSTLWMSGGPCFRVASLVMVMVSMAVISMLLQRRIPFHLFLFKVRENRNEMKACENTQ
jgi:hypothetical protein